MTLDNSQLDALIGELGQAIRRSHARRRNRRMIGLVATVATALFASVAVAGSLNDWWTGATPPADPAAVNSLPADNEGFIAIDLSKKALVASIPGSQLDAVATKSGGYCLIAIHGGHPIDSGCDDTPVKDDGTASRYTSRTSQPEASANDQWWIGWGRVTDAGAASLDLSSVGLSSDLQLERGGFFLFEIPKSQWSTVADRTGSIDIRDAAGKTIRKTCFWVGLAPGTERSGEGTLDDAANCSDLRPSPPPTIDYGAAQKVAELTYARDHGEMFINGKPTSTAGLTVAIWEAPDSAGETCSLYAAASEQPTQPFNDKGEPILSGNPGMTMDCLKPNSDLYGGRQIQAGLSEGLSAGEYTTFVQGAVAPTSKITKLELVDAAGKSLPISYGGRAFIAFVAELPNAPKVGKSPGLIPGGPFTIKGYDAAGHLVASQPVQETFPRGKYEPAPAAHK